MRIFLFALFALLAVSAFAIDFTDDFEGYNIGDDPADSPQWFRDDTGGYFEVIDDGGDQIIESIYDGHDSIGYGCLGAGLCGDASVSIDFKYSGYSSSIGITTRADIDDGTAYAVGLYFFNSFTTFVGIYYTENEQETELYTGFAPITSEDTWNELEVVITGDDPVNIVVNLNGALIAEVDDGVYLLPTGLTGFGTFYTESEPVIHIDDFTVDDLNTGIKSASLGEIKTTFK